MLFDILMGVGYKGGVENVVNKTASFFVRSGHKVRIVQLVGLDYEWVKPGPSFYALTRAGENSPMDTESFSECYRRFLEENGFPTIVLATGWPNTIVIAKKALKNTSYVIPVISWLHGCVDAYSESGLGGYEELKIADAHLAINDKLAKQFRSLTQGYVMEVTNPIDTSRIIFSEERNTYKLAFVGRVAQEKNIPFLLDALRMASPVWTLDIVGDSDENGSGVKALREYCRQIGVEERVTFHGWLNNPWEVLTDAYALVLPSLHEASPLVAVEAMLCGMPVIATPTDGIIEKIVPGENGYLFPFNDREAFLKILKYIETGSLPRISPLKVRQSMKHLDGDGPLQDMLDKIISYVDK